MACIATPVSTNNELFQRLEEYPWNSDEEFQHGLLAILGANPSEEQAKHLTLRARCFYYARKFNTLVDFASYEAWHNANIDDGKQLTETLQNDVSSDPETLVEQPPYPLSFNEIVDLITNGKPIPGIKEIPGTVLEGQASESRSSSRKKPWES